MVLREALDNALRNLLKKSYDFPELLACVKAWRGGEQRQLPAIAEAFPLGTHRVPPWVPGEGVRGRTRP